MKILLVSDLHVKYAKQDLDTIVSDAARDLLIVLGDFSDTWNTVKLELFLEKHLQHSDVLYVLGNHEYYAPNFYNVTTKVRELFDRIDAPHKAYLLERDTIVIDGIRFIGTTLWSCFNFSIYSIKDEMMHRATLYKSSEYETGHITYLDILSEYYQNLSYIESKLMEPFEGITVVLTHHAPSFKSIATEWLDSKHSSLYATNLEHLMYGKNAPEYWFHGHTHEAKDYVVGETRVISNPHAYAHLEPNSGYKPDFLVDI